MGTLQITIDCADPARLVPFWAAALGYVPAAPPAGHDSWNAYYLSVGVPEDELLDGVDAVDRLVDPEGVGPRIWFQIVPETKSIKNRLHLDLDVSDRTQSVAQRRPVIDARAEELVALGATVLHRLDTEGIDHYGVTLADPEGNEFCLS